MTGRIADELEDVPQIERLTPLPELQLLEQNPCEAPILAWQRHMLAELVRVFNPRRVEIPAKIPAVDEPQVAKA